MTKNGTESVSKGNPNRDSMGRFLPGSPGGPGRKTLKPISLSAIEMNLQQDLKSTDAKIRHNATKLLLLLRKAQSLDDPEGLTMLDPRLQKVLGVSMSGLLDDTDVEGVEDE
jgi:hypothetical protein